MTASEQIAAESAPAVIPGAADTHLPVWRRARIFGTGFAIAISENDLEAAIVRSRPSGSRLVAATVVRQFSSKPAAEWGAEVSAFLNAAGDPSLAATLVLPREEVIVRTVRLAGVAEKDTAAAIELQLDTLHPWDEEPVEWDWWRVSSTDVVVGVVQQSTLSHYETLFSEAGIPLAAVTFSSAVIHAALRLRRSVPASIFCYTQSAGRVEVYGESEAKPCYSAGFSLSASRALAVALAELRLAPDQEAQQLAAALDMPGDASASPLAWAAALAASAPFLARFANLLPAARRASHSKTRYLIPVSLAALALFGLLGVFVIFPFLSERALVKDLTAEQLRLMPAAQRVQTIDRILQTNRARIAALDDFRRRPQADLDVFNELVRILPEQVWTSSIEVYPDSVTIAGEAEQAAPLLKLLDSSPLFEKSEFVMSVTHNNQTQADQFRIKSLRRGRAGRTTP
jgi:Tfp pilus assembly protein PilN